MRTNPNYLSFGKTLSGLKKNKTGLQPVSRPVEQVHYFGGWVKGTKSLWCQGLADRLKTNVELINRVNAVFNFF